MLDAAFGSIGDYSFAKATVEMRSLSCPLTSRFL